jgi:hypothetical protein
MVPAAAPGIASTNGAEDRMSTVTPRDFLLIPSEDTSENEAAGD